MREIAYSYCLALGAAWCLATVPAAAQRAPRTGTMVIAHGADTTWNAYVRTVARQAETGGPIAVSFLMGPEAATHRFQDVAAKLEREGADEIVVVPLLISSHSGHYEQIRFLASLTDSLDATMREHLHHAGIGRASLKIPIRVARALDDSPAMARILTERALALATTPRQQALFIVGHGPNSAEDYAAWMDNLRRVADSVRVWGGFKDVRVDVVRDDAPAPVRREAVRRVRELIELQHKVTGLEVVVVPALISRGRVSRERFLADLAGLPVIYRGEPLLPHAVLARWIEQRVRETATQDPNPR